MSKPIVFRAYADRSHRYWTEVRVFDTQRQMQRDIRHVMGSVGRDTAGQVSPFAVHRRRGRLLGIFAIMWLNKKHLASHPTEVVTHESLHAAVRYFERRGWNPCLMQESIKGAPDTHERCHEERLAYAVGRIAADINRKLFRVGVWK